MKAIYFPLIPRDPQSQKQQKPAGTKITGSSVYIAGVFEALVRYSSFDVIYLPDYPRQSEGDPRDSELFVRNAGRLRSLAEHDIPVMQHADHLILAAPFPSFSGLIRIRRLCQRPRTPITAVIHSVNYASQLTSVLELFLYPVQSFDALICSSTAGQQAMVNFQNLMRSRLVEAGLGNLRSHVKMPIVPLGVETEDFVDIPADRLSAELSTGNDQVVLLYFGRFSPTSKADLFPLLIVFADIAQFHPEIVLVLAGDDTHYRMAGELQRFAGELGCADQVRVIANPTSAQKQQLYGLADVFVSLADNLQETFGISVVEAMAAGLPVVVSDWNGYKDIVAHGETGYLVPTFMPRYPTQFDDIRGSGRMIAPDLLAATTVVDTRMLRDFLEKLIANKEHRCSLGLAGRRRAFDLYDWKRVIRQYELLWAELEEEASRADESDVTKRLDLNSWGYEEIFGHYATALIDGDFRIWITELGKRWRSRPEMLAKIAVPQSWFQLGEIQRILELLDQRGNVSVGEFLGDSRHVQHIAPDTNNLVSLSHLCRLMKYGLVDFKDFDRDLSP
jgi:D-inositol-3-phosphate glycosyltransferase